MCRRSARCSEKTTDAWLKEDSRELGNKTKGYLQRRACGLVGIDPRVYRYRSTRSDDAGLRQRLKELASERRRFGYRRLHILLKREGIEANWKKVYRIYREKRLTVRKRGGRKRALGTRAPMAVPQAANQRLLSGIARQCPAGQWVSRLLL